MTRFVIHSLSLVALIILSGCGIVRDEPPEPRSEWPNGVYGGGVEWLILEMELAFEENDITGTAGVTRSPLDGIWENDDILIELDIDPNARITGEWTADWGEGSVRGVMQHPLVGLTLVDDVAEEDVGRLRGVLLDDGLAYAASYETPTDTTDVRLEHRGPLPMSTVDVTGELENGYVYLHLGPAYQYVGQLSETGIDGLIEFPGIIEYRLETFWSDR